MIRRLAAIACAVCFLTFGVIITASAEETAAVAQAYMTGGELDFFLTGDFNNKENLEAKAANKPAEMVDSGTVSDKDIAVRTTIIVDVSTSVPGVGRNKIKEFLSLKIKNIEKNEEIRLVTFGSEIKVLQDFTSDRYDLDKAAATIAFKANESAIFDALYNTIPEVKQIDGKPCLYRTIALTDGADYTGGGMTKEELLYLLKTEKYPVDMIRVGADKPVTQHKDLYAVSRMSSGRYFDLYSETDCSELVSALSVADYFWSRAKLPAELLDGSTRQIDISDGRNSLSFDMKMSVVDVPEAVSEASEPSVSSEAESVFSQADEKSGFPLDRKTLIIIVIAVVGSGGAAALIIILVTTSKHRKKAAQPPHTNYAERITSFANYGSGETELFDDSPRGQYSIKLSNIAAPDQSWVLDVSGDIIIGRGEGCNIRIEEKSVSREQCRISARSTGLVLFNVSSTNPTRLNGIAVSGENLLNPADNIHFGRVTLRVDHIQKIGANDPPFPPGLDHDVNIGGNTQSIF